MNFDIEVLSVSRETKPTQKGGSYIQLDVAFKNLTSGKTEGKKIMSFVKPDKAYKALNEATTGSRFTVTSEKPEGEQYWQWTDVVAVAPGSQSVAASKAIPAPKSTYETSEERAKKQVYIVKQSSISNAIAMLSVGAKSPPSVQSVVDTAQRLTDWVFASQVPANNDIPLLDMPEDVPE